MKLIQVIYGYTLLVAVVYLISKAFTLFLTSEHFIFGALLLISIVFLKINPHSERHRYPFAFDVQLSFLHRN